LAAAGDRIPKGDPFQGRVDVLGWQWSPKALSAGGVLGGVVGAAAGGLMARVTQPFETPLRSINPAILAAGVIGGAVVGAGVLALTMGAATYKTHDVGDFKGWSVKREIVDYEDVESTCYRSETYDTGRDADGDGTNDTATRSIPYDCIKRKAIWGDVTYNYAGDLVATRRIGAKGGYRTEAEARKHVKDRDNVVFIARNGRVFAFKYRTAFDVDHVTDRTISGRNVLGT
jgi:hypothetical protein